MRPKISREAQELKEVVAEQALCCARSKIADVGHRALG
jgi:hypothetical protein